MNSYDRIYNLLIESTPLSRGGRVRGGKWIHQRGGSSEDDIGDYGVGKDPFAHTGVTSKAFGQLAGKNPQWRSSLASDPLETRAALSKYGRENISKRKLGLSELAKKQRARERRTAKKRTT